MQADRTPTHVRTRGVDPGERSIRNMHDVFSNWYRQAILYYLQDRDEPATVSAVSRQLVEWREAESSDEDDVEGVERMRSRLVQAHVAAMDDFGVLEFDPDDGTLWIPDNVAISVPHP